MGSHFADTVELGSRNGFAQYFIGFIQFADGFIGALAVINLCFISVTQIICQSFTLHYGKPGIAAKYTHQIDGSDLTVFFTAVHKNIEFIPLLDSPP